MYSCRHSSQFGHSRNARRANKPPVIMQIGLNNIHTAIGNHPSKSPVAELLFAPRNGNIQCIGNDLRIFEVIKRTRLFKINSANIFEHTSHFNRLRRIVRTVGIRVDINRIAEHLARQRDQIRCSPGHGICIFTHAPTNSKLYGWCTCLIDQPLQIPHFFFRRAIPPPTRNVKWNPLAYNAAQEIGNGFLCSPTE